MRTLTVLAIVIGVVAVWLWQAHQFKTRASESGNAGAGTGLTLYPGEKGIPLPQVEGRRSPGAPCRSRACVGTSSCSTCGARGAPPAGPRRPILLRSRRRPRPEVSASSVLTCATTRRLRGRWTLIGRKPQQKSSISDKNRRTKAKLQFNVFAGQGTCRQTVDEGGKSWSHGQGVAGSNAVSPTDGSDSVSAGQSLF